MSGVKELIDRIEKDLTKDKSGDLTIDSLQNEVEAIKKNIAYNEIHDIWINQLASAMRESVNYTNIIIVGAYVAFFTMWTNLYENLHRDVQLTTGLLIAISAASFIINEIYKMYSQSNTFYGVHLAYEQMNEWERKNEPEKSLALRQAIAARENSKLLSYHKIWRISFWVSTVTGLTAAVLLIGDTSYCLVNGS